MGLFGFGKKEKDKMKDGLEKTRTGFWGNILNTLTGSKIDDDLYDELEEQLILADVGGDVAMKLVDALRDRVQEKGLKTGEQAADALRDIIADEMRPPSAGACTVCAGRTPSSGHGLFWRRHPQPALPCRCRPAHCGGIAGTRGGDHAGGQP